MKKHRLRPVNSLCVILHAVLESDADEGRHVDAFPHGEVSVRLQRPDEQQQERLVEQQVVEQFQTAVKPIPPRQVNLLNIKQERQRGVWVRVEVKPVLPCQVNLLNIKQERQRGAGEGGGERGVCR